MIKVKHIHANSIYVLEGLCCANTNFVENEKEVKIFLNLVSKRLGGYMKVLDYVIQPCGWQLIVQTNSEYLIKKNYLQKISGKTHPPKKELGTVRLIIGEAIRILRSRFTNITNPLRGRKGNASKGVFQKHLFDNIEEAKTYISKVRNHQIDLDQPNEKYRVNSLTKKKSWQAMLEKGILNSERHQEFNGKEADLLIDCLKLYDYLAKGFENLIIQTLRRHNLGIEVRKVGFITNRIAT